LYGKANPIKKINKDALRTTLHERHANIKVWFAQIMGQWSGQWTGYPLWLTQVNQDVLNTSQPG